MKWLYKLQQKASITSYEAGSLAIVLALLMGGLGYQYLVPVTAPIAINPATHKQFQMQANTLKNQALGVSTSSGTTSSDSSSAASASMTTDPALPPPETLPLGMEKSGGASRRNAKLPPAPVNLNTAGASELQRLPGVGEATAQKILAHRHSIGRFSRIEQMMDVKGIGEKKFAKMKPYLRL